MTRPYSNDLRERALARVENGETIRSVATALQVSPSCVSKWGALKRRTGHVAPGKIGGHRKPTLSGDKADWLRARMRASAFTLRGLVAELGERGVKVHARAVWVFAHAEGLSFKKNARGLRADASGHRAQKNAVEGSASQRRS
jgi:transposase